MNDTTNDVRAMPYWGADLPPENRPGIPMEREPRPIEGAHWTTPEKQKASVRVLKRPLLDELTPVFGTAQPPRGVSGLLRTAAYRIPSHRAGHWLILIFADRVDVMESTFRRLLPFALPLAMVGMGLSRRAGKRRKRLFGIPAMLGL